MDKLHKTEGVDDPEVKTAMKEINEAMSEEMQRLSSDAVESMQFSMQVFELRQRHATSTGKEMAYETQEATTEATKAGDKSAPG